MNGIKPSWNNIIFVVSAPSGAGPSGGAPATRGSQWAKRWAANGAYQTQAQIGAMEQAVEAGDER